MSGPGVANGRERSSHRPGTLAALIFFWTLLVAYLLYSHVIASVQVVGESMEPTLMEGDRRIVHKWLLWVNEPERKEIVVIRSPRTGDQSVKRIIGLPGETIRLRGGFVEVDGHRLSEPYLRPQGDTFAASNGILRFQVPDAHYFVLGDNRRWSYDSRHFGPVSEERVLGKIIF